jgi:ribosomal protein S27E
VASDEKHPIRNGIIIAVISAAILYGATFISGLARGVAHVALRVGRFLADTITLPRWLFIIVCIFALVAVYRLVRPLFGRAPREASVKDYRMDSFFGVIWRWRYGFHGSPEDIWCFCPRCDTQLVYTEDRFPDRVWFTCEHCGQRLCESEGSKEYVLSKVFRQIDRKIRNGEWKHAVVRNV